MWSWTPSSPSVRMSTEYRKLRGEAVRVGIWTVTQCRNRSTYAFSGGKIECRGGYIRLLAAEPADLNIDGRPLSFRRHEWRSVKVGTDGSSLTGWDGSAWSG